MISFWVLLGSMIACDVVVCGDLRRVLTTTARGLRCWHEPIATHIVASGCDMGGKDYRWE